MLPLYYPRPIFSRITGVPLAMSMVPPPSVCPTENVNMYSSITMTDEYDSRLYGGFRHVRRDLPKYRHVPFDWYRRPQQQYNVIHEDVAIVTLDGLVPISDFYRYYIDNENSLSYNSEEYDDFSDEQRNVGYRSIPDDDDFY